MTRILVVSDSHGRSGMVQSALLHDGGFDWVFHLGDGAGDLEEFLPLMPQWAAVRGNCDAPWGFEGRLPFLRTVELEGMKILLIHSHQAHSHHSMHGLYLEAEKNAADLVLFGHTHHPVSEERNGVRYFNPGALKDGSAGLLVLNEGKIQSAEFIDLRTNL